jgi:pimeloyl-ACP methyl ester carboxylesterase
MPGYGFSGKPTTPGWDPPRIARTWVELMKRLGYDRFVAQGGDWGAFITELMAAAAPPELLGIHINMPSAVPLDILTTAVKGGMPASGLSIEEQSAFDQLKFFFAEGLGYAIEMGHRPQTLYAIADSPVGLAAWLSDHDWRSYELKARAFAGNPGGITRDDVLDNATLFWLTNTAISAARLYWENEALFFAPLNVTIPVAVSAFPDELYQAPRSWVERAYPKLLYFKKHDEGGHFAAWEQPERLVADIRAGFKSLR